MQGDSIRLLLSRLWRQLSAGRKRQFWWLASLMALSALLEAASLGALIPFLTFLANPEKLIGLPVIAAFVRRGLDQSDLVVVLASSFALTSMLSAGMRLLLLRKSTLFSYGLGTDFSTEVYRVSLYQPYSVHLTRNSSLLVALIAKKVGVVVAVISQLLSLAGALVVMMAVLGSLLAFSPTILLSVGTFLVAVYAFVSRRCHARLRQNSQAIAIADDRSIKLLQEGLGGIRDVLLDGAQEAYATAYTHVIEPTRRLQAENVFMAAAPRYVIEASVVLAGVLLVCLPILRYGELRLSAELPLLGAFLYGGSRLLPTLQQIYFAWAGIIGNQRSVCDVLDALEQPKNATPDVANGSSEAAHAFDGNVAEIALRNVRFSYSASVPPVLKDVTFRIRRGDRIGVVGETGSGKSTLLDIVMGLLEPQEGVLSINGSAIGPCNRRAWQRHVAHVPQHVFLADKSIAENIALAASGDTLNPAEIGDATRRAKLDQFIATLPDGYDTVVGERGVRLSGGQRQRIGIARALYRKAPVIILDEATSALDDATELQVMESIEELDRSITILIVAHRLSTLRNCDRIIEVLDGYVREHDSIAAYEMARATALPVLSSASGGF